MDRDVTTTCGYCGVGCRLEAHAVGGRVVSIAPALDGPANKGHTCLKGRFAHQFSRSRDRLRATSARLCSSLATTGDLPAMTVIPNQIGQWNHATHPLATPDKTA